MTIDPLIHVLNIIQGLIYTYALYDMMNVAFQNSKLSKE